MSVFQRNRRANQTSSSRFHAPSAAAVRIIASSVVAALVFGCITAAHHYETGAMQQPTPVTVRVARQNVQVLAPDVDTSVTVDKAAVQQLIDAYAQAPGVGTTYSLVAMDAQGNVIAGHDENVAREPASTTKTLTAFAAASTLDLYSTLDTQVYLAGGASNDTGTNGAATIVLKGNGDVLLGTGANDASHINGRAGIATLVQRTVAALQAKGITSVTLDYDDSLFGSKRLPDGVDETNANYVNEMPGSSMAIDLDRQWGGYANPDPDHVTSYPTKTDTPALNVATEFASQLAAAGIAVTNADAPASATTPSDASMIASVQSAPLWEVMKFMLKNSSNTLAEEFGRLVALKTGADNSPEGAVQAVTQIIKDAGIHSDGLLLKDCSGLTLGTRISATTLADVQRHLALLQQVDAAPVLEGELLAGVDRTYANYDHSTYGSMMTKTGTQDNVRSLTGTIATKNGGIVFFATVCADMGDWAAAGAANDAFANGLAML